jgi:hypothetical protein
MNIRVGRLAQMALGLLCMVMAIACKQNSGTSGSAGKDAFSYPFIQQLIAHQIDSLDSSGQSLTYVDIHHGKQDSSMAKASTVRDLLVSFLQPSGATQDWAPEKYRKAQFMDSVHHLKIMSYEAINDTTKLNRVDVSLDSATGAIRQLYIQQVVTTQDSTIREQLIWKADQFFSLITMVDKHEYTSDIRKQKFIWGERR